jgi:hypothetical protein
MGQGLQLKNKHQRDMHVCMTSMALDNVCAQNKKSGSFYVHWYLIQLGGPL